MVAVYQDLTKLRHAKMIAKEGGCFIVEKGGYDNKEFFALSRMPTAKRIYRQAFNRRRHFKADEKSYKFRLTASKFVRIIEPSNEPG